MSAIHALVWILAISSLLVLGAAGAGAEYEPIYLPELTISRASGEIRLDGRLDDPGWRGVPEARNFAEHQPGDQVKPPVDTVAYLTYDEDHLYAAFVCYDDPEAIRATFCERDRIFQDDMVFLLLDTYGDQSWAYEIAANPYGIQADAVWSASGEDFGYDLVYDSVGAINHEGFVVEMAIPFSSLRFPEGEEQVWRVDFWRNRPREVRGQYSWAAYDRDESCWPCQWGTVYGLRDLKPGRGLELLPSFVATQSGTRRDDGDFDNRDVLGDASLGAKMALNTSFMAEGTYNPDFSQVEADAAQIDVNTTFALFFPERRPFFQEGSDLFSTFFDVVYTRSINDPQFAGKLTGRPGRTNLAFLSAVDENSPYLIPLTERSEFVAAGRSTSNLFRARQSLGEASHVGLIATDRRREGGGAGTVVGADACYRMDSNHQVEVQLLASRTAEPDAPHLTADLDSTVFDQGAHTLAFDGEEYWGHAIYASVERHARRTRLDLDFWEYSPTFRAENGFVVRNNRRQGTLNGGYTLYRDGNFVDRITPSFNLSRVWDFQGTRKDEWLSLDLETRLAWGNTNLHTSWMGSNERFEGIDFDGIWRVHQCGNVTPNDMIRGGLAMEYGHRIARGDLVMGKQFNASAWVDYKPVDRVLIENAVDFIRSEHADTGEELFEGYIFRSRWGLQLTRELAARLVLQYNDFRPSWEMDPLLTYRINPFSIFYVGSTRDYRSLDAQDDGVAGWKLTDRQYFLKLQYLFQI